MTKLDENASEVAQVIARLARHLPEATARDLRALLAHRNATGSTGYSRQQKLGLLIEMMRDRSGEMPTTTRYADVRKSRFAAGETWPSHSTLIRAYGHWLNTVRAAMALAFDGSPARIPGSYRHAQFRSNYRHDEILQALIECRNDLGNWPTQWEYEEWSMLRRKIARSSGLDEPRFPSLKPIRTLFGDFDKALKSAKRWAPA